MKGYFLVQFLSLHFQMLEKLLVFEDVFIIIKTDIRVLEIYNKYINFMSTDI